MAISADTRRKGCFTVSFHILFGIASGTIILIFGLSVWQDWSSLHEDQKYPPRGQLYQVGEVQLHLHCTGIGSPTVLLVSGLAAPGLFWERVQPELAKSVRVCSYDRAGLGRSDPSANPRTVQNIVDELHALLDEANIDGPYLMVGHSFGGYIVRVYAKQYPDDVVGIALVAAGHEDFNRRMPSGCEAILRGTISIDRLIQPLAQLGIARTLGHFGLLDSLIGNMFEGVPPALRSELLAQTLYKPQYWKTKLAEEISLPESEAQARSAGNLGDLPLVVVSGSPDVARVPATCQASSVVTLAKELQVALTDLSSNSVHIICDICGHYIPMTDPQLVVEAVQTLLMDSKPSKEAQVFLAEGAMK